jgi:hypothetical protein
LTLGLTADGCDDGDDGDLDDIDALSFGSDLPATPASHLSFSVSAGAQGVDGSGIADQNDCPPGKPGAAPEPEGDIFSSALNGTNSIVFDGNGPIGACTAAFPLGIVEAATVRDDVDAVVLQRPEDVDAQETVFFSLDTQSPTLAARGFGAADILMTTPGGVPSLYASGAQLGLLPGDDLDGLCLRDNGDNVFDADEDVVYFSIAPRLTDPGPLGATAGDILAPGSPARVVVRGPALGLAAGDDVDALDCEGLVASMTLGDVDCDSAVTSLDALLILQHNAGLLTGLPCQGNADLNSNGSIDSIDALIVLQTVAGLI